MNFSNNLKDKIKNRQLTIGSWISIPNQSIIEIMKTGGFDWLTIDIEHSATELNEVLGLVRTIQASGMDALVRVTENEECVIKRVLDIGANGIIVPMIKNEADVMKAYNSTHYPPEGKRGVGLFRAQGWGKDFDEYLNWSRENLVIVGQIEHIEAVNNIHEILNSGKLDAVLIGPYDLSASMGKAGQFFDPEVKLAIEKVVMACKEHNVVSGFHVISSDPQQTIDKVNEGHLLLAYSLDFMHLGDSVRKGMEEIKRATL